MTEQQSHLQLLAQYAAFLQGEKRAAPATQRSYLAAAQDFVELCARHPAGLLLPQPWDWADVDKRAVELYLRHLAEERDWQPRSLVQRAGALRAFFGWLQQRGLIARNPARNLKPPAPPADPQAPEGAVSAVRRLFEEHREGLDAARVQLCLELLYGGGLRPVQVYDLEALEVDEAAGLIRGRCRGADLSLPLGAAGLARASRYLALRAERLGAQAALPGAPFWVDSRGRACSEARLARGIKRALEKVGLDGRPSALRRLSARHFREQGGDLRSVQHLMGARRLGGLDMFAETDYRAVLNQFRAAHPRQQQRGTATEDEES